MRTVAFDDLLRRLDDALTSCRSLGLNVDRTRFGRYRDRVALLTRAVGAKPDHSARRQIEEAGDVERLEFAIALIEGMELAELLPHLRSTDPECLREKLKAALSGPVFPSDVDLTSNRARNILLELNLAAKLARAGFGPRLSEAPDLICGVGAKTLFFECKRPFVARKIPARIKEAGDLLRKTLRAAVPGTRGIVAISVSKLVNPGTTLLVGYDECRVRQRLDEAVEELGKQTRREWDGLGRKKIIAILFHAMTPAGTTSDPRGGRLTLAEQIILYSLSRSGTADGHAVAGLARALEAAAY